MVVAGYKQTLRALRQGRAAKVFYAADADPKMGIAVMLAAEKSGVPAVKTTMRELGKACGIDVPTAAAAVINDK